MTKIRCRLINWDDSNDVLNWRNDILSREMSINATPISLEEHSIWFNKMLENTSHFGFIGELNHEKIGVVFMKIHQGNANLSINLNPSHRGQRLGKNLLKNAMQLGLKAIPVIDTFTAEIKNTNLASIQVFAQNGFKLYAKAEELSVYKIKSDWLGVNCDV